MLGFVNCQSQMICRSDGLSLSSVIARPGQSFSEAITSHSSIFGAEKRHLLHGAIVCGVCLSRLSRRDRREQRAQGYAVLHSKFACTAEADLLVLTLAKLLRVSSARLKAKIFRESHPYGLSAPLRRKNPGSPRIDIVSRTAPRTRLPSFRCFRTLINQYHTTTIDPEPLLRFFWSSRPPGLPIDTVTIGDSESLLSPALRSDSNLIIFDQLS